MDTRQRRFDFPQWKNYTLFCCSLATQVQFEMVIFWRKEMTYNKWLILTRLKQPSLKQRKNWLFLAFLWLDKNSQRWLYSYQKNITYFNWKILKRSHATVCFLGCIVVSIPACHAGDRGSIPRRGEIRSLLLFLAILNNRKWLNLSEKFKQEFRRPSVSWVV